MRLCSVRITVLLARPSVRLEGEADATGTLVAADGVDTVVSTQLVGKLSALVNGTRWKQHGRLSKQNSTHAALIATANQININYDSMMLQPAGTLLILKS